MQPGKARMSPPDFNRVARLQRHNMGTIAYADGAAAQSLDLPPVGYHFRVLAHSDLSTLAIAGGGRWLSGHIGGNTNRFRAPWGLVTGLRYALNVASPVYFSDGYGNHLVQLTERKGEDPFVQIATSQVGYARKERALAAIYNETDGTLAKPDDVVTNAKTFRLRMPLHIPLTLGDAALIGLVPVQDIRIRPQLTLDFGGRSQVSSGGSADMGAITGNFTVFTDLFTVPHESVRPDTSFIYQTLMDTQQVAGTGDQDYRPQIGGTIMRVIQSFFNSSKAIDPYVTIEERSLIVQQGVYLQRETPVVPLLDEKRYYGKILPDECMVWDFTTGAGDPTMPSFRDRIATSQATWLTFRNKWSAGTAVAATAEIRSYRQQMVPVQRIMG